MNTLKHRTLEREGYQWSIEVREVRTHGPVSREAVVKRAGERWITVQLLHAGKVKVLKFLPYCVTPESIMVEVRKDLNVEQPNDIGL